MEKRTERILEWYYNHTRNDAYKQVDTNIIKDVSAADRLFILEKKTYEQEIKINELTKAVEILLETKIKDNE